MACAEQGPRCTWRAFPPPSAQGRSSPARRTACAPFCASSTAPRSSSRFSDTADATSFSSVAAKAANLAQIISTVRSSGYLIVQEYVAAAARGDKRVLLLAGVPLEVGERVAVYRRLHASDDMPQQHAPGRLAPAMPAESGRTRTVRNHPSAPHGRRAVLRRTGHRGQARSSRSTSSRRVGCTTCTSFTEWISPMPPSPI